MAKYDVTFSCGHTETVEIFGPTKERTRKIKYFREQGICSECYKEQIEAAKKAKIEDAKAAGLPELTGTEKQIAWAEEIRWRYLTMMKKAIGAFHGEFDRTDYDYVFGYEQHEKIAKSPFFRENVDDVKAFFQHFTAARWYIDNQDLSVLGFFKESEKAHVAFLESMKPEAIAYEAEITVEPKDMQYETVATVYAPNGYDCVSVKSDYDRALVEFLKGHGFTWHIKDREWFKNVLDTDGTIEDRVAETGNALLNAGWPVRIPDAAAREKAINGTFEPRYPRWVHTGKAADDLFFKFEEDYDVRCALGKIARQTKHGTYFVKISAVDEVEEFAEMYGFRYTAKARKMIDDYKASRVKVTPAAVPTVDVKDNSEKLEEILNSKAEVIDRLAEDDIDDED